ncbi:MAG: hypothetical protein HS115_02355 [Spirochaetales bacterium]|nr:hypothetical protein [Spirochaetales bacterium]
MSEQIPPGFTPEVWNQLTPEQKATFKQSQSQSAQGQAQIGQPPAQSAGGYPGMNQQADMMNKMQKMTMISMAVGMLSSLVYSLTSFFRNR